METHPPGPTSPEDRLSMYRFMLLARLLDDRMRSQTPHWHSSRGEEAVIVGAFYGLRPGDWAYPHFRGSWAAQHVKGVPLSGLFADLFGKANGASQGKGFGTPGSREHHVVPMASSALGAGFTIASGVALALQVAGAGDVVVMSFGEGTSNRGEFHESLNFTSLRKLPIVFACQNNQYAVSTHVSRSVPTPDIADRATAYGMPGIVVDGNDVLEVNEHVLRAVSRARLGEGPSLVECKTYRISGHYEADAADYRSGDEVAAWAGKCPIDRLRTCLMRDGFLSEEDDGQLTARLAAEVDDAFSYGKESARPPITREHLLSNLLNP